MRPNKPLPAVQKSASVTNVRTQEPDEEEIPPPVPDFETPPPVPVFDATVPEEQEEPTGSMLDSVFDEISIKQADFVQA